MKMADATYRVTLSSDVIGSETLSISLLYPTRQVSRRGDRSARTGRTYELTTISLDVESLHAAIEAIEKSREAAPGYFDVAEVTLDYAYDQQCNIEFSVDELRALARLGAALNISCWQSTALNGS